MKNIGLYLHIPFCSSKCPYCDFYSFRCDDATKEQYVDRMLQEIEAKAKEFNCKANTLYIGGGTPSVLDSSQLCSLVNKAKECFLTADSEITVECNPHSVNGQYFKELSACGVNRISMGLQSANDSERRKLGRRASSDDVKRNIENAKQAGIRNISLDVMLGIPDSTPESLKKTLEFCVNQDIQHISCYILKLEENTPFYKMQNNLNLPDDDTVADMYLFMCEYLESHGFMQYEISNFAKQWYESKHNLKYWNCEEYLGLGASAHSFMSGKRFYCERNAKDFIACPQYIQDGDGGGFEEYAMLKLRLKDGIKNTEAEERFGFSIPKEMYRKAEKFSENGFTKCDENGIRLTRKGFLVSNTIISELIY